MKWVLILAILDKIEKMLIEKHLGILETYWRCIGVYISLGTLSILNAICRVINTDANIDRVIV